jgi:hypothetical protein
MFWYFDGPSEATLGHRSELFMIEGNGTYRMIQQVQTHRQIVGKYYRWAFGIVPAISIVALLAAIVLASGTTGDRVLGQLDFVHVAPNLVDARGLFTPHTVAIDASVSPNRVYVADADNNRVLGWKNAASFANGAPADLVIGQPDFISSDCNGASGSSLCNPAAAAVDASGNLYVADSSNSRVLE